MAFSLKAARENKNMFDQAMKLWKASGYDPADTPRGGASVHKNFLKPYYDFVIKQMTIDFPDIPHDRVRGQVMKAKTKIYSAWVRGRDNG